MESVNWVCEEVLEEHEWVSPLTISLEEEEEEVLRELTHVLHVVQWWFLSFVGPSILNVKLDRLDARIVKYHEPTN